MPTATGTSTMTMTSTTLPNCSGTTWPVLAKVLMAQLAITGMVTMDSRVLMAVSEMFIATLPPKRWLNRLAEMPPGRGRQQHQAHGEQRRHIEQHDDGVAGHGQHDDLQHQRHPHGLGVFEQAGEVLDLEGQAQAQHDQRERRDQQLRDHG
jgi:hypothetical protein